METITPFDVGPIPRTVHRTGERAAGKSEQDRTDAGARELPTGREDLFDIAEAAAHHGRKQVDVDVGSRSTPPTRRVGRASNR
jgi:hypothetical protein